MSDQSDPNDVRGESLTSTTRRGALAALGLGGLAALSGSASADVGGGPDSDAMSEHRVPYYRVPESDLDSPGVVGRRVEITSGGSAYSAGDQLVDTGSSWELIDPGYGSVNVAEIDSTVWALEQAGANGGIKLQAAIDDAASKAGTAAVIVSGAPDDLSGQTNADQSDGWLIDSTLKHKSNVFIKCVGNPYFFLAPDTGYFLENDDISNGTSNFGLSGGVWDCNGSASGNDVDLAGGRKGNFYFQNVSDHYFDPNKIQDHGPNNWATHWADWENIHIGDVEFYGDKDGIHLHGPGKGARVDRVWGDAGDDILALTTAEYDTHNPTEGDISDVQIGVIDVRAEDFDEGGFAFAGNSDYTISDVTIDEYRAGPIEFPVIIRNDPNIVGDGAVQVNNFDIGTVSWQRTGGGGGVFLIAGNRHRNISIGTIQVADEVVAGTLLNLTGAEIHNLSVDNIQAAGADLQALVKLTGANVKSLEIGGGQVSDGAVSAGVLLNEGTMESISITDFEIYNDSFDLINGGGATVGNVKINNLGYIGNGAGSVVKFSDSVFSATISNSRIKNVKDLLRSEGQTTPSVSLNGVELDTLERIAVITGSGALDLRISNVDASNFQNTEFFIDDDTTLDIEEQLYDGNGATGTMFQGAASGSVRVDGPNTRVRIGNLSGIQKYDRAYNTDSGNAAGVGEVIWQGSAWKNFDSI